jgi:hypothetical protein
MEEDPKVAGKTFREREKDMDEGDINVEVRRHRDGRNNIQRWREGETQVEGHEGGTVMKRYTAGGTEVEGRRHKIG